jgi:sulfonate transport system substrate-binding protein
MRTGEEETLMMTRRHLLAALPAFGIAANASAQPSKFLRIGFQKGEPMLVASKQNRAFEMLLNPLGIDMQWVEFQFGPPMLEAMRVNAIDIGAVGDTPPIFAQAAHGDLLYIAAQRGGGQAILVPPGSKLETLQDLKGKKVAFGRGSSAHSLLIAALEKASLNYSDIQPIYLGPADAGAAFERGSIDAWSIWDPYYALFEARPGVRVLAKWTDITEQNSFFMASRAYVEANTATTVKIVNEFMRIAGWAREHRPELATLISKETGMPIEAVQRAADRAPFTVLPMNDEIVRTQQRVANRFRALGLIPIDIKVSDEVWRAST